MYGSTLEKIRENPHHTSAKKKKKDLKDFQCYRDTLYAIAVDRPHLQQALQ